MESNKEFEELQACYVANMAARARDEITKAAQTISHFTAFAAIHGFSFAPMHSSMFKQ